MPACSFVWRDVETAGLGLKIFISWYVQLWMLLMKPDANAERVNRPLARDFPENNTLMDAHWIIFGTQFSHHPRTESGNWTSQNFGDSRWRRIWIGQINSYCSMQVSHFSFKHAVSPSPIRRSRFRETDGEGMQGMHFGILSRWKVNAWARPSTSWHHYSTVLVVRMSGESVFASRRLMYNRINNRIYHIEWLSRFPLRERLAQLINRALTVDVQIVLKS